VYILLLLILKNKKQIRLFVSLFGFLFLSDSSNNLRGIRVLLPRVFRGRTGRKKEKFQPQLPSTLLCLLLFIKYKNLFIVYEKERKI
jgi:hypothetical protein